LKSKSNQEAKILPFVRCELKGWAEVKGKLLF